MLFPLNVEVDVAAIRRFAIVGFKIVALAESNDDIKTADLLTDQLGKYEEFAWMLRATVTS